MSYKLYWGDLHSHCSVSYGHGSVEQALARAKQQLDFCSITGHAFWPDMPADRDVYAEIIDYHNTGFARLARNWEGLLERQAAASIPHEFIAFPSYEWHSLKYGDHNVYAPDPELPLRNGTDLPHLRSQVKEAGAVMIPHHIGYAAGYRGIDWSHFQADRSPFVEIFSLHGCSLDEHAPYPMLHDMGPRDFGSTAQAGWDAGHRFGIVGGTDHHGAYPGSHGDGRMGVFASELTRERLWDAFLARRVFAATGDRIDARLFVNDAWIGSEIHAPGERRIQVAVHGADALDTVDVIKNGRLLRRFSPTALADEESRFRVRITWGWGRKDRIVEWKGSAALTDGTIHKVESCFSGQPIVAPKTQVGDEEIPDDRDLPHAVTERSEDRACWRSMTKGNPTMRHETTQAISLEIDAGKRAALHVEVNDQTFEHPLEGLRAGGRVHYLQGWLSEAIRIGPATPLSECRVEAEFTDSPEREVDVYRLQVRQHNGQCAWLSPIWASR